ncbi:MAG: hypothetical protein ACYC26_06335 [Phycisphaerales bacterium]
MAHGRRWELVSNKLAVASMTAMLAGGLLTGAAKAEEEGRHSTGGSPTATEPTDPNTGAISLWAGVDFYNEYIWRGIPQQDQGLIMQPAATVTASLWSNDDWAFSAFVNTWNSVHSQNTGYSGVTGGWYEGDWAFGASVATPGGFTVTPSFVMYHSPNGSWADTQEMDVNIAYNDAPLWGDTSIPGWAGLKPYALFAFETSGGADILGKGGDLGTYLELGISPSFTLIQSKDYPVTISFPMKVGLSLDKYYEYTDGSGSTKNPTFGYFDGGVMFSIPLAFIPSQFGAWEAHAGVHFVELNSSYVHNVVGSGYDEFRILGTAGVSMTY